MSLERIVKLLPLGAVLLIGLGVLKTSIYYNYFGVDIMSYLSTTDVLTLFLNDYQSVLLLFIIGFIHFDLSEKSIDFIESVTKLNLFDLLLKMLKWILFSISVIVAIILTYLLFYQVIDLKNGWIYLYCFNLSNVFAFFLIKKKKGKELYYSGRLVHFFQIICVVLVIPFFAYKDIRKIEKKHVQKVTLTFSDNTTFSSYSENKFLGKAGENYFFYSPKKKITTIIKSENVERIEIKS